MIYFENVPNIGNLCMDYVFHYDDQPILFSLKDEGNDLYLCVCYELYQFQKWFITKVSFSALKAMADNKSTVLDLFLRNEFILQAQRQRYRKQISYQILKTKDIDPDLLPEESFYLGTDSKEQEDFDAYYNSGIVLTLSQHC